MGAPDIDVLIPVHNAASTLDASLASISAQTVRNIQIIVVDDGSTDATPARLADWVKFDPRIKVFRIAKGGIVNALNMGLQHCTAPYLARCDADDIAFPERLACQRAYLEANSKCVATGCAIEHIDENGVRLTGLPQPGRADAADAFWAPAREPYIIHPFLMARREALMRVDGYRHVPNSEDSDLCWRLAEIGHLHNSDEVLGQYRMHQYSISGTSIEAGRMMAIGSQLGAVSAQRRRMGKPDLIFEPGIHAVLRRAATLESMSTYVEGQLAPGEAPRFRLAVAIKLLELAAYRPYEIEGSDCVFIRSALASADLFTIENRGHIRWHVTDAAQRLLRRGDIAKALALTPPACYVRTVAKTLRGWVRGREQVWRPRAQRLRRRRSPSP